MLLVSLLPLLFHARIESALPTTAPTSSAQSPAAASDYEALDAEYEAAYKAWRAELKEARKDKARKEEVEARPPVKSYRPRFEALIASDARAYLWLVANAGDIGDDKEAVAAKRRELLAKAVADHATEPWMSELLEVLPNHRKALGVQACEDLHLAIAQRATDKEIAGSALVQLADLTAGADATPEDLAKAKALLARASAQCPGTEAFARAAALLFRIENLRVGCSVPDFEAQDGDGVAFKLSDYRGKVVLIDFWGFW